MANYPKCPLCGATGPVGAVMPNCACDYRVIASQGTEARSAETTGSARKGDGPVANGDAPDRPDARDWQNRAERAEAECNELRALLDHALDDVMELAIRLNDELIDAPPAIDAEAFHKLTAAIERQIKGESNGQ